ncbi:tRNA dimethylallyltransferase [Cetobacterium ceti]|uniref:tRNA dimethylallyltransferase n=1 Tax=Cetobacterium ceti TaxID=180163 RepID=A0A1T4JSC2_9FUSO|nr:tRNA (adenosine(37)-N6)-dimethylallyltransferase MiaA [Cetobacterium ceti]SJZ33015.1 tRNA dimethylallyltransferase [Cetobacterium ceti]
MKGIVIAGPTGVGKTDLSIKLAKLINGDIISADSAQVYKGMDVGTAKVTKDEMDGVKHYLIDIVEPIKKYSVGDFQREVDEILSSSNGKNIILAGGTGLYINSITEGLSSLPVGNLDLREKLMAKSSEELFEELKKVDLEASEEIHMNNKRRVERALEVFYLTGEKFSVLSKRNIKNNNYKFLKIGLERDRAYLYERINMRVDIMIKNGLIEEVKELYDKYGENLRKINIIGYSEIIDYFKGEISLEVAIDLIKRNSRRYAKRQFTWFKNDPEYIWYDLDKMSEKSIIEDVLRRFESL